METSVVGADPRVRPAAKRPRPQGGTGQTGSNMTERTIDKAQVNVPPSRISDEAEATLPGADNRASRSGLRAFWRRFRRNRLAIAGAAILALLYAAAAFAPLIATHDPDRIFLMQRFGGPSAEHWLGTDETGRDVFSRLVYGSRVSLTVGLLATVIAIVVGAAVGATAGYAGGVVDSLLMRVVDGMLTIPTFFLALLVLAVFGPSMRNLIVVIGLTGWMVVSRRVRPQVLRAKNEEVVAAAGSLGASPLRILARHVFPQAIPSLIVAATLGVAHAIIVESSLSFLGLGVRPP